MADKVKLAKFCELRLKFCKPVNTARPQSVCVCTIHQNFKFIVEKVPTITHYTEVLKLLVCNKDRESFLMRKYGECPGYDNVERKLLDILDTEGYDLDDPVSYSQ